MDFRIPHGHFFLNFFPGSAHILHVGFLTVAQAKLRLIWSGRARSGSFLSRSMAISALVYGFAVVDARARCSV